MAGRGGDEAELPALLAVRGEADGGAVRRQMDLAAVQVQEDQPARRLAQVVDPGDGLLAAVAALLEVDGGADPAQLVGDGPVVGLQAQPGAVGLDAQCLQRQDADRRALRRGEGLQVGARQEQIAAVRGLAYDGVLGHLGDGAGRKVDDGDLVRAVGDLDPVEELHALQVGDQRLLAARFGVHPGRLAVVDEVDRVLDVAVRGQDQGLGGVAGREVADVLGEQQMQPAQPFGAGDGDHAAVGEVHEAGAVGEGALLTEEVAVVRGDAFVGGLGGDGAGQRQKRAGGSLSQHGASLRLAGDRLSRHPRRPCRGRPHSARRSRNASCPYRSRIVRAAAP